MTAGSWAERKQGGKITTPERSSLAVIDSFSAFYFFHFPSIYSVSVFSLYDSAFENRIVIMILILNSVFLNTVDLLHGLPFIGRWTAVQDNTGVHSKESRQQRHRPLPYHNNVNRLELNQNQFI